MAQGRFLHPRRADHAPQRHEPMHATGPVASARLFCRAQIAIVRAARPRATSRGFVLWCFSDAGPSEAEYAALSVRRHPKTFPHPDSCTAANIPSFDHLVDAGEQRARNRKAERPGGLEVDDKFETCW